MVGVTSVRSVENVRSVRTVRTVRSVTARMISELLLGDFRALDAYSPSSRHPSESYLWMRVLASTPKSLNRLR
jgi:hypothetical protein